MQPASGNRAQQSHICRAPCHQGMQCTTLAVLLSAHMQDSARSISAGDTANVKCRTRLTVRRQHHLACPACEKRTSLTHVQRPYCCRSNWQRFEARGVCCWAQLSDEWRECPQQHQCAVTRLAGRLDNITDLQPHSKANKNQPVCLVNLLHSLVLFLLVQQGLNLIKLIWCTPHQPMADAYVLW